MRVAPIRLMPTAATAHSAAKRPDEVSGMISADGAKNLQRMHRAMRRHESPAKYQKILKDIQFHRWRNDSMMFLYILRLVWLFVLAFTITDVLIPGCLI